MNDVVETAATGALSLKEKRQAHAAKMRAAAKAKREARAVAPSIPASAESDAQQLVATALGKMALAEGEEVKRKSEQELMRSRRYVKDGGNKVAKTVRIVIEPSTEVAESGQVPIGHNGSQYLLRAGVEAEVPEFILDILDAAVLNKPVTDPVTKKYTGRLVPQKRFNYRRVA